ncbi:dihydroneopterin aldolase [Olivibacter sp. SDN3]|uniref:dihydroneopterin aldolase n=1 Tax=Olivibacter sp. SDN3 TaxID=2764720 RepID=UPI00165132E0|nr:dihydroneopterin aldolase [Olivibacter sp. SDN3]QNL51535.1 dihydroneopterin aldolase [Olivibacter sp. SDN3]
MGSFKQKIALTNARFFAFHGYYPEEQILGNEFFVDISCTLTDFIKTDDTLTDTLNYESLYKVAKDEMAVPKKLLETVVGNILQRIQRDFPAIDEIDVTLKKNNPPFGGDITQATVSLHWKKDDSRHK